MRINHAFRLKLLATFFSSLLSDSSGSHIGSDSLTIPSARQQGHPHLNNTIASHIMLFSHIIKMVLIGGGAVAGTETTKSLNN